MKNSTIWIIVAVVVVVSLGGFLWWKYGNKNVMPGSDRDEHGCIGSAGYTWCEAQDQCLREWETPCTSVTPTTIGGEKDANGCYVSAGYSWCEAKKKCIREWEENCTASDSTSGVTPPKYLSQMDDCSNFGGKVEEQLQDMGTWTAIGQWKCTCAQGQSFSAGLQCNQWYTPATQ